MSIPPRARRTPGPTEQNEADNLVPTNTNLTIPGRFQQFSGARVWRSTNLSFTTNQTQGVTFDTEIFDTDNYWDGGDKFYVPQPGFYFICYQATWDNLSSTGGYVITIHKYDRVLAQESNVGNDSNWPDSSGAGARQIITTVEYAEPPEYFRCYGVNVTSKTISILSGSQYSAVGSIALIGLSPGSFMNQLS